MGASISVKGRAAKIRGVKSLHGAEITATDLRAGASLIVAGLIAQGTTKVRNIHYIDRGYEYLQEKLRGLGAKISRESDGTTD